MNKCACVYMCVKESVWERTQLYGPVWVLFVPMIFRLILSVCLHLESAYLDRGQISGPCSRNSLNSVGQKAK